MECWLNATELRGHGGCPVCDISEFVRYQCNLKCTHDTLNENLAQMAQYLTGILRIFSDDAETESNVHLTRAERIRAYQEENKHLGALVIVSARIAMYIVLIFMFLENVTAEMTCDFCVLYSIISNTMLLLYFEVLQSKDFELLEKQPDEFTSF